MDKRVFYSRRHVSQGYDQRRFGGLSGQWVNRRELSIVSSLLPPEGRVLDLGCGSGRLSLHLAHLGYEVIAVDSSAEMLAIARGKADSERVAWVQGDVFALPVIPNTFDVIVALRLAFHFKNLRSLLAASTAAKPGGTVVFDTYNWSPRALAALGRRAWGPRVYVHRPATVIQEARRIGLEVIAKRACFLFSPYVYRLLPLTLVRVLERLESLVPASLRARVFWQLRAKP